MSDESSPRAGGLYDHFKGGRYRVIAVGHLSEARDQEMVVYTSLEKGTTWIRPLSRPHLEGDDCWNDLVDWPDGVKRPRFVRTNEASIQDQDAAIDEAFPTRSGRHDLYAEAMRLVGSRRSKGALVALVNWLLVREAKAVREEREAVVQLIRNTMRNYRGIAEAIERGEHQNK